MSHRAASAPANATANGDQAPLSILGQHNVTVVPVYWGDAVPPTAPSMQSAFDATDTYYDTISAGRIRFQTNVLDWQQLPQPPTGCFGDPLNQLYAEAQSVLDLPDDRFHTMVLYAPQLESTGTPCSLYYAGMSDIWDGTNHLEHVILPGQSSFSPTVVEHELGHSLGLYHSGTLTCFNDAAHTTVVPLSDFCNGFSYYGDPWDTMGNNFYNGQMSAAHLDDLGLLDPADKRAVATNTEAAFSTTVHLDPVESGAGLRLVTFNLDGTAYSVEDRTNSGLDSRIGSLPAASNPGQGVLLRQTYTAPDRALDEALINLNPTSAIYHPGLVAGKSWTAPDGSLVINVTAADATGADVTFTWPDLTPPKISQGPVATLAAGTVTTGGLPVTVTWADSDAGGIANQVLSQTPSGSSQNVPGPLQTAASSVGLGAGHFALDAVDTAGLHTSTTGPDTTAALDSDARGVYLGGWRDTKSKASLGGSELVTENKLASYSQVVTARSVGLVATTASDHGDATVFVDGKQVGVVSLNSPQTRYGQQVWTYSWPKPGTHIITVVNQATPHHKVIDIDALTKLT